MRVRLLSGARDEFAKAELWYDEAREGLGGEFFEAVSLAISDVKRHPRRYLKDQDNIRHRLVSRFPFAIFYQIQRNEIVVVAISHTSRSPGYWQSRVTKK